MFAVIQVPGPAWDHSRGMREQKGWDDHAKFMDALAAESFIVLGGPIGEGGVHRVLHAIDAKDADAVEARLAQDPWRISGQLRTESIEPWTILLSR